MQIFCTNRAANFADVNPMAMKEQTWKYKVASFPFLQSILMMQSYFYPTDE
jgi:hypothetical protein